MSEKTNTGCKGHYWTKVMSLNDMRASKSDIIGYNNYRLRMDNFMHRGLK